MTDRPGPVAEAERVKAWLHDGRAVPVGIAHDIAGLVEAIEDIRKWAESQESYDSDPENLREFLDGKKDRIDYLD